MSRALAETLLEEHLLSRDIREVSLADIRQAAAERPQVLQRRGGCRSCHGLSGPILDVGDLFQGKTLLTAHACNEDFLEIHQITSTIHSEDLDSIPPMDAIYVIERLAKLEEYLLTQAAKAGQTGFITIAKRRRQRQHGYQRIRFHHRVPSLIQRDRQYREQHGGSLAELLELNSTPELTLGEFRGGLAAVIPAPPRRPLEIVLFFRPSAAGHLYQLSGDQRWGIAQAIREISGAMKLELCLRGQQESYRWALHAGDGPDTFVRFWADKTDPLNDGPEQWADAMREHLGLG